jgi:hypothetical protein
MSLAARSTERSPLSGSAVAGLRLTAAYRLSMRTLDDIISARFQQIRAHWFHTLTPGPYRRRHSDTLLIAAVYRTGHIALVSGHDSYHDAHVWLDANAPALLDGTHEIGVSAADGIVVFALDQDRDRCLLPVSLKPYRTPRIETRRFPLELDTDTAEIFETIEEAQRVPEPRTSRDHDVIEVSLTVMQARILDNLSAVGATLSPTKIDSDVRSELHEAQQRLREASFDFL